MAGDRGPIEARFSLEDFVCPRPRFFVNCFEHEDDNEEEKNPY